jgi:hypothetical protein
MRGKIMFDEENSINKSNNNDKSWDNAKYYDNSKYNFNAKSSKEIQKSNPNSKGIKTSNISDEKLKSSTITKDVKYSNISDEKKKFNDFNNVFKSSTQELQKSIKNTLNTKKKMTIDEQSKSYEYNKDKIKPSISEVKYDSEDEGEEDDESEEEEDEEEEEEDEDNSYESDERSDSEDEEEKPQDFDNGLIAYKNSKNITNKAPIISSKKTSQKIVIPKKNNEKKIRIVKNSKKLVLGENKFINSNGEVDLNALYSNEELQTIKTPFTVDIIQLADECFDIYQVTVKYRNFRLIDINEVQNLLDVLGIKKNLFEIKNCILDLKRTKKFRTDDKYNKQNFLDIVEFFKNYRIDDKLLAEVFRSIDSQCDGYITFEDIQYISRTKKLNFTKEEINDILNYFELEDITKCEMQNKNYVPKEKSYFNFEKFCKLYYQG